MQFNYEYWSVTLTSWNTLQQLSTNQNPIQRSQVIKLMDHKLFMLATRLCVCGVTTTSKYKSNRIWNHKLFQVVTTRWDTTKVFLRVVAIKKGYSMVFADKSFSAGWLLLVKPGFSRNNFRSAAHPKKPLLSYVNPVTGKVLQNRFSSHELDSFLRRPSKYQDFFLHKYFNPRMYEIWKPREAVSRAHFEGLYFLNTHLSPLRSHG